MKKLWYQIGSLLLCAVTPARAVEHCPEVGLVSMTDDQTIHVSLNAFEQPFEVHPDQSAYQGYLEYAGGLQPGETKPLRAREAIVEMAANGSLTVAWLATGAEAGPETILPGSPRYDEISKRLGEMRAGERKVLFPPNC